MSWTFIYKSTKIKNKKPLFELLQMALYGNPNM